MPVTEDLIARGMAVAQEVANRRPPRRASTSPSEVVVDLHPDDNEEVSLLGNAFTAADLQRMEFPPLVEFVPRLITEGIGMLVGGPKIGKSWMALDIALGCSYGGMVFGKISVNRCAVLYLALEDGKRRLQSRIQQLSNDGRPWPDNLTLLTVVEQGQVIATINEWYEKHPNSLVILDTLSKNRSQRRAGADAYLDDYAFGTRLKRAVDTHPGSALLCVHHDRKQHSEDFVQRISGTNGLAGAMDYLLLLDRKRQSDEATIHVTGRDVSENEYAMTVTNGRWELDGMDITDAAATMNTRREKAQESKLSPRSLDIMKFVNSRETTAPAELAKHLDIDNTTAGTLLGRLHDRGYIGKNGRGTYVPIRVESVESVENPGHADALAGDSTLLTDSTQCQLPGGITASTPGNSDRVQQILARVRSQTNGATA